MGEANTTKRNWLKELRGEFKKIIWPDKISLFKQTSVVLFVCLSLGLILAVLDYVYKLGIKFLTI